MLAVYIVAGVLASAVLLLAVPLDVVFQLRTEGGPLARARLEWFFGMARKEVKRPKGKPAAKRKREPIAKRVRRRVVVGLVRRLMRAVRFRNLDGTVTLGLGDPASTGMAYGFAQAAISVALPPWSEFQLVPDFAGESFEADVEGRVRVYPLKAAGIMIAYVFSREGRAAVRKLATGR